MRLELGSGAYPTPGYVHLDVNPDAPDVDIVGPAYPLDLPDGLVNRILAVDVLEHIDYRLTDRVLAEWARVAAPGCQLYVQVPDGLRIAFWLVEANPKLLERLPDDVPHTLEGGAAWRLFGGLDDGVYVQPGENPDWNLHRALFSKTSLNAALGSAGWDVVSITSNDHPNLMCDAVRR
jgi:SAM-dependent methyltransferase